MPEDFEDLDAGQAMPSLPGEFRLMVAAELRSFGLTTKAWHSMGVDCVTEDGDERYIGLANLYRRVKGEPADEWPGVVREFFRVMIQATDEGEELPKDLHEVAARIRVRIGQPFSVNGSVKAWQQMIPGTDLAYNLVIDSERYMTYVTEDVIEAADKPAEHWLEVGLANLHAATPADWLGVFHEESGMMGGHISDSYDAARCLILDRLQAPPVGGWLLVVPSRDWFFCLPLTGDSLPVIPLLKIVADKNFAEEAYPISDQVYFVKNGEWEVLPIEISDQETKVSPGPQMLEALQTLDLDEPDAT
jgi:hypothetical protein